MPDVWNRCRIGRIWRAVACGQNRAGPSNAVDPTQIINCALRDRDQRHSLDQPFALVEKG
jgi:hypothetical protein